MAGTLTEERMETLIKEIFQKEFKNLHFKNQNDNPPSPTPPSPILPPPPQKKKNVLFSFSFVSQELHLQILLKSGVFYVNYHDF